ncbi:hypothetical protein [Streptomyces fulvorobeus]|uniref:Uncharacterized protein n=1 Tax=Streptomyces fulvorobeus TaxID=284028 RepID=A0A7J0C4M6_9ACTN|nr:hypothetical protein [Streptomyces fulvorobeus]NYE40744.1 hypothetical protein [Streptomyces fulvorobeus]GFM97047.1 hypothetical protein Sfulv_18580 [Streptomyces fulvorobeus]
MNGRAEPTGYRCEVRAEGLVYGTGRTLPYVLGTFRTISPVLALRWIRSEARRIADRLDPDPRQSAWVRPFMRVPHVPVPDGPTGLRAWADDPHSERVARERIKSGDPLSVVIPDMDCRYTLSVWPEMEPTRVRLHQPRPGRQPTGR